MIHRFRKRQRRQRKKRKSVRRKQKRKDRNNFRQHLRIVQQRIVILATPIVQVAPIVIKATAARIQAVPVTKETAVHHQATVLVVTYPEVQYPVHIQHLEPYVWGAAGPNSFDCSGLVSFCLTGRYSHTYSSSDFVGLTKVSNPQPGDICVRVGHVGVYIGGGQMIHAPHTGDVVKISAVPSNMWYVRP